MDAVTTQLEAAQTGAVQRTQRYVDTASLKVPENQAPPAAELAAPAASAVPVEPVKAPPRQGGSVHVVA